MITNRPPFVKFWPLLLMAGVRKEGILVLAELLLRYRHLEASTRVFGLEIEGAQGAKL